MPKVDSMAMLMPKVVVMYDHDEFLPDVMLLNINLVFKCFFSCPGQLNR